MATAYLTLKLLLLLLLHVSLESAALVSPLCPLFATEQPAIQFTSPLYVPLQSLPSVGISCIRNLLCCFSGAKIIVFPSLTLIPPEIFHFNVLSFFQFLLVKITGPRLSNRAITTFIPPPPWKSRGGDKELISAIITIQTLCR